LPEESLQAEQKKEGIEKIVEKVIQVQEEEGVEEVVEKIIRVQKEGQAKGLADMIRVEGEGILRIPGIFRIVYKEEGSKVPV